MVEEALDEAGEKTRERVELAHESLVQHDENSLKRWILLAGNRGVVAFVLLLLGMIVFVVMGVWQTTEMTDIATETAVVETLLFTLLSGTILLVSVAVSINSIVLSQEITDIGTQKDNVEESLVFRETMRELTNPDVSPAQPTEFLLAIIRAVRRRAKELESSVEREDSTLNEQVSVFVDDVDDQVDAIEDRLQKGEFGTSKVLLAGLDYDYSWQMYAVRRLQVEHEGSLSDDQERALDELGEILKQFTTGREYFKTLFFKRELAAISRWLLIVAFPVILFTSYALLVLKANLVPDVPMLPMPSVVAFVIFAYVVALTPYALFTTYILRLATIAYRTLAAGPFILQGDGRRGRIDWKGRSVGDDAEP